VRRHSAAVDLLQDAASASASLLQGAAAGHLLEGAASVSLLQLATVSQGLCSAGMPCRLLYLSISRENQTDIGLRLFLCGD
jgi:hypothetical protein